MRRTLTAFAAAAAIAVVALAGPATADDRPGSLGPAIVTGVVAGTVVSAQVPRPYYPGPVVYEYAQPGATYYEYYALPPQYLPPAPLQPCWNSPGSYRFRAC